MFNLTGDKKIWYFILGAIVIVHLSSIFSNTNSLIGFVLTIPAVLIAITFHEFAHAFTADKLGDDTPRREGRLSLNPLAHLDPIGSIMLIFAGFGWGKPVEVNPRNFNRKLSMTAGEALVAFAGPAMNIILSIIFTIILCIVMKFFPNIVLTDIGMIIVVFLEEIVVINIGLGIFNLIPLPPLDGSKILIHFLSDRAKDWFEKNTQLFSIIFMVLWITGVLGMVISPVISIVYSFITNGIGSIFGI